jgi:hypothetical protein
VKINPTEIMKKNEDALNPSLGEEQELVFEAQEPSSWYCNVM